MKMRLGWASAVVLPNSFYSHCTWPQHGLTWPFTLLWRTPSFSPPSKFLREGNMCSIFLNQDSYSCNTFFPAQIECIPTIHIQHPQMLFMVIMMVQDKLSFYISQSLVCCAIPSQVHSGYDPSPSSSPAKWMISQKLLHSEKLVITFPVLRLAPDTQQSTQNITGLSGDNN